MATPVSHKDNNWSGLVDLQATWVFADVTQLDYLAHSLDWRIFPQIVNLFFREVRSPRMERDTVTITVSLTTCSC